MVIFPLDFFLLLAQECVYDFREYYVATFTGLKNANFLSVRLLTGCWSLDTLSKKDLCALEIFFEAICVKVCKPYTQGNLRLLLLFGF